VQLLEAQAAEAAQGFTAFLRPRPHAPDSSGARATVAPQPESHTACDRWLRTVAWRGVGSTNGELVVGSSTTMANSARPAIGDGEGVSEYDAATMAVDHAPPEARRSRRAPATPLERGYLALTAALYPDGNAVSAEILEFDIASWGHDFYHAYAMIVEAVEGAIAAVYHDSVVELETFLRQEKISVHPRPPRRYRPAIPSHLLSQPGLILRPVSISIEAALRD
jgi:hypothetical protein